MHNNLVITNNTLFYMKKIFIILISLLFLTTNSNVARASGSLEFKDKLNSQTSSMEDLICNVLGFLTGGVGKALAAFACMGIALAFLGGKVSWTLILTFSLGMACIFGAPTIIKAFTGGDAACEGTK